MLIVGIVVAIVAIAAVGGAYVLLNGNTGTSDQNGQNAGNNDANTNTNQTFHYDLANGDYMVFKMTTESSVLSFNATLRWQVSNVTVTSYDVMVNQTSDFVLISKTWTTHVNMTDQIGSGIVSDNYKKGVLIGNETLSTPLGDKKVEHWRVTEVAGNMTTMMDFYVGKDTRMVYKWVITVTDPSNPSIDSTVTGWLEDTNIDTIRNGDGA